jgi:putative nucleotidyltransferase with HDIG domain
MDTPNFSQFKSIGEYETFQKSRILYAFLLVTSLATIPMGISNLNQGEISAAVSLFVFSFLCILGLVLNYRNDQRTAAILFAISGYFVIFYNLAVGGGLRDTAIVALPLITIFAGLLFGKRATLVFTATTILAVLIFQTIERNGIITPDFSVGNASLLILNLTLIVVGLVEYIFMGFWERNLQWVQYSEERIRDSYEKTLEGLAWALEFRDRETEGHSQRVVDLSLKLAKKLKITDSEELNQIRQGALLHDIGKMAVPDNVLLKPGPLTDDEWVIIKKHPELAKSFLERLPLLSSVLDIPYSHHENWDGTGYPLGLEKEQIPLQARIFSIIDNWDALNSDRPYRKAWERDKIIGYLKDNAGKKFDPMVVPLFLDLIEEENL